jgi:hypothetical protein
MEERPRPTVRARWNRCFFCKDPHILARMYIHSMKIGDRRLNMDQLNGKWLCETFHREFINHPETEEEIRRIGGLDVADLLGLVNMNKLDHVIRNRIYTGICGRGEVRDQFLHIVNDREVHFRHLPQICWLKLADTQPVFKRIVARRIINRYLRRLVLERRRREISRIECLYIRLREFFEQQRQQQQREAYEDYENEENYDDNNDALEYGANDDVPANDDINNNSTSLSSIIPFSSAQQPAVLVQAAASLPPPLLLLPHPHPHLPNNAIEAPSSTEETPTQSPPYLSEQPLVAVSPILLQATSSSPPRRNDMPAAAAAAAAASITVSTVSAAVAEFEDQRLFSDASLAPAPPPDAAKFSTTTGVDLESHASNNLAGWTKDGDGPTNAAASALKKATEEGESNTKADANAEKENEDPSAPSTIADLEQRVLKNLSEWKDPDPSTTITTTTASPEGKADEMDTTGSSSGNGTGSDKKKKAASSATTKAKGEATIGEEEESAFSATTPAAASAAAVKKTPAKKTPASSATPGSASTSISNTTAPLPQSILLEMQSGSCMTKLDINVRIALNDVFLNHPELQATFYTSLKKQLTLESKTDLQTARYVQQQIVTLQQNLISKGHSSPATIGTTGRTGSTPLPAIPAVAPAVLLRPPPNTPTSITGKKMSTPAHNGNNVVVPTSESVIGSLVVVERNVDHEELNKHEIVNKSNSNNNDNVNKEVVETLHSLIGALSLQRNNDNEQPNDNIIINNNSNDIIGTFESERNVDPDGPNNNIINIIINIANNNNDDLLLGNNDNNINQEYVIGATLAADRNFAEETNINPSTTTTTTNGTTTPSLHAVYGRNSPPPFTMGCDLLIGNNDNNINQELINGATFAAHRKDDEETNNDPSTTTITTTTGGTTTPSLHYGDAGNSPPPSTMGGDLLLGNDYNNINQELINGATFAPARNDDEEINNNPSTTTATTGGTTTPSLHDGDGRNSPPPSTIGGDDDDASTTLLSSPFSESSSGSIFTTDTVTNNDIRNNNNIKFSINLFKVGVVILGLLIFSVHLVDDPSINPSITLQPRKLAMKSRMATCTSTSTPTVTSTMALPSSQSPYGPTMVSSTRSPCGTTMVNSSTPTANGNANGNGNGNAKILLGRLLLRLFLVAYELCSHLFGLSHQVYNSIPTY